MGRNHISFYSVITPSLIIEHGEEGGGGGAGGCPTEAFCWVNDQLKLLLFKLINCMNIKKRNNSSKSALSRTDLVIFITFCLIRKNSMYNKKMLSIFFNNMNKKSFKNIPDQHP